MFKLVVLSALVAIVAAKPGGLLGYSAYAPAVAVPAAVSHQYRTDVISKPVIATYAAPIVQKTVVAAPAVYSAPLAYAAHSAPLAYAAHSAPLAYAAHSAPLAYAAPYAHAW
ncbi:pupal cuticle protein C1B-like [Tribolium madens]|uniref:pupal cuticle protein C1B-like n=1 Tax=Tribolium madens TaxID=41895 RepID=UPI001CF7432F|nr:pupal cuticle protein C1B-like [Tribolium madens]